MFPSVLGVPSPLDPLMGAIGSDGIIHRLRRSSEKKTKRFLKNEKVRQKIKFNLGKTGRGGGNLNQKNIAGQPNAAESEANGGRGIRGLD